MNIPKAFCIALDRAPEKWKAASESFQTIGLKVELFPGFDGEALGLRTVHTYEIDHPGSNYIIGPKYVGMCLSHIALWKAIKTHPEWDSALILEDDAMFISKDAVPRMLDAIAVAPTDWDLIYIGSCNTAAEPRKETVKGLLYELKWPSCTHAYLVRQKALDYLISSQCKIWAPIDLSLRFLSFIGSLKVYTVLPRLVDQRDTVLHP